MEDPQTKQTDELKTTDTNLRYAAYLARLRNIAVAVKGVSRYLAYTSDVGEAFRPVVPVRIVQAAYAISWLYVGTDVTIEGYREHNNGGSNTEVMRTVLSRSIFQSLASMGLPAFAIHTQVHMASRVFQKVGRFQKWGPTVAGLALVPFLPYMFDHPVEFVVEKTFDTLWPTEHHHGHGAETQESEKSKKE